MLVPMALQTPSLLYATTALSAIHIQALHNQSESVKSAPDIARLMALSLEHFRTELQNPSSKDSEALVATARTLCLAEIHSGAINPNSWRAHIDGARALMRASDSTGEDSLRSTTGFRRYLDRWYWSIVSLTALTGNGPPIGETSDFVSSDLMGMGGSPDYLDDYWGFSVDLAAVFRQIGAVAWRNHEAEKGSGGFVAGEIDSNVNDDAEALELAIRGLMSRDSNSQPSFYPGAAQSLSAESAQQLLLCNEAFQHSALIQIHRRLRKTPTTSPVFRQIGAVAWRNHEAEKGSGGFVAGEIDSNVNDDAEALELAIRGLMSRDSNSQPSFYPGAAQSLSAESAQQLLLCNEAFQHSALIQIHRRLRKTPTTSPEVQQSVQRILECTAQIGPSSGLTPWVMLTTPIFIAGCEARGADRDTVRQLLSSLHDTIRVPNVLQSLRFLEQYWSNQLSEEEDWSHFLGTMTIRFPISMLTFSPFRPNAIRLYSLLGT